MRLMFIALSATAIGCASAQAATVNLIANGDFNAGNLTGWIHVASIPGDTWGTIVGPAGAHTMVSPDGTRFATPYTAGGTGLTETTLYQRVDLTGLAFGDVGVPGTVTYDRTLHASADAIFGWDRIGFTVRFTDAANAMISEAAMGLFGGPSGPLGGGSSFTEMDVIVPPNAATAVFIARATRADGMWIDSGFDNAALLATPLPVPEPTTLALLPVTLLALRRR